MSYYGRWKLNVPATQKLAELVGISTPDIDYAVFEKETHDHPLDSPGFRTSK